MAKIHLDHEKFGFGIVGPLNIKFISDTNVKLEVPKVWVRELGRSLRAEKKGVTISPDNQGKITIDEAIQTGRRRTPTMKNIRLDVDGPNKVHIHVGKFREAKPQVIL